LVGGGLYRTPEQALGFVPPAQLAQHLRVGGELSGVGAVFGALLAVKLGGAGEET